MRQFMAVAKALADENRVRALMFLREGELCVCQIMAMLELAPSTVSKHLSVLAQAGLVEAEKRGRWRYYRRTARPDRPARLALKWLDGSLKDDPCVLADGKRLRRVSDTCLETLCAQYKS